MTMLATSKRPERMMGTLVLIWVVTALLTFATWIHVETLVTEGRDRELRGAERDLATVTRLSQEHVNRTLRSADQAIRFVQNQYLEMGPRLNLAELAEKGVIDTEIFNQVGVIDNNGIYILSNLPIRGKLDLSDREHFRVHVEKDSGELFVSKPVLGRASGKWSIQLTRRITRANGEFGGVVVISIDPGYFTRFYKDLNLGPQGLAALYGLDGVARARMVGQSDEFGSNAAGGRMFTEMAQGRQSGSYVQRSVVDGVERIYFYRKVPNYQLAVTVAQGMQILTENQRRAEDALRLQAVLVSILLVALATALTRHLLRIHRDIDARRAAKLQIEDRTEQLNAIFALSPDGFVSFDRNWRVKYVNPAFAQMTDLGSVRLDGLGDTEFSAWLADRCQPQSGKLDIAALRAAVVGGRPGASEVIELSGKGKRILKVGLRCSDSLSVSQILYFRDVTHETEVDHMKSEFLSTAAHELRTPMASIYGFAEILLNEDVDPDSKRDFLGIIYKQSQLMAKILDELLDLARIEARRKKDFRYSRLCLQDVATEVCKSYMPPAGREAPQLRLPALPLHVMADSGKLRQALLNVISNAYKYSPGGGPVIVEIALHDADGGPARAGITVMDEGIGMTPEQVSRVCERFYRADKSGKTAGTGLGMSIVKEIIELHGGELTIDSERGRGTQVRMFLPA